jgi:hypothetical protein
VVLICKTAESAKIAEKESLRNLGALGGSDPPYWRRGNDMMTKLQRRQDHSMKTAFKEWAAICRALGTGEQIVILRKGGIVERGGAFRVEYPEFLLFPTFLHQTRESLVPAARHHLSEVQADQPSTGHIVFRHFAAVAESFQIHSEEELPRLRGYHVWSDDVVAERFRRWQKSLHVLVVRVYALPQPVTVPLHEEYAGCKSWVKMQDDVSVEGARPVVSDEEYQLRADEIGSKLRRIN